MLHTRGYGACAIVAPLLSIYMGADRPATGLLGADMRAPSGICVSCPSLCLCLPGAARESDGAWGFVRVKIRMKTWFDLGFCVIFVVFLRVFVSCFFVVSAGQGRFLGRVLCMVFGCFCPTQATVSSVTFLVFWGFDLLFHL